MCSYFTQQSEFVISRKKNCKMDTIRNDFSDLIAIINHAECVRA